MRELFTAGIAAAVALILYRKKKIPISAVLLTAAFLITGLVCCFVRGFSGEALPVDSVPRGEEGTEGSQAVLEAEVDQVKQRITLDIPALRLKEEEAREQLKDFMNRLDGEILGDNSSFGQICYPLQLQNGYEGSDIDVQWQSDHPDYLGYDGSLGAEIPEEGAEVLLKGELLLGEYSETYTRRLRVYPSRAAADLTERLRWEAEQLNREEEEVYRLPEQIDGREIHWYRQGDSTGWMILGMGLLLPGLLLLLEQEKRREKEKKREEQLDREYPDLVSRMQLLLGAGLSMRMVFERIGAEYQENLEAAEKRRKGSSRELKSPACEEILVCCRELKNGYSETEVYRHMGSRCKTASYRGLALLLEQNITKGGQGLLDLLEAEALEAFELRQRRARQEGERISVRLLLPMGIMLVIVLALIMIPAFLNM
ncbi:MAG: type II secretion system F family protein [Lachnospiraceae bacterium]|nr:type II secretion system F family protein [Lachnospiraceae bacterium]